MLGYSRHKAKTKKLVFIAIFELKRFLVRRRKKTFSSKKVVERKKFVQL